MEVPPPPIYVPNIGQSRYTCLHLCVCVIWYPETGWNLTPIMSRFKLAAYMTYVWLSSSHTVLGKHMLAHLLLWLGRSVEVGWTTHMYGATLSSLLLQVTMAITNCAQCPIINDWTNGEVAWYSWHWKILD